MEDEDLVMVAEAVEEAKAAQSRVCLPAGWIAALPVQDQQWISKALFKWSGTGKPELDFTRVDRLRWDPPQPSFPLSVIPPMENYFGHPLFLWMPKRLWAVRLLCPREDCGKEELTSAGLHQGLRQVVGVRGTYFMAAEYLVCKGCKRKVISWSGNIIHQLNIGHRVQFPCVMTSKMGCDMKVMVELHQGGPWNSSTQVQSKLEEQHTEAWQQKQLAFLTDYRQAVSAGLVGPVAIGDMPEMLPVPEHGWLLQAYDQDVEDRLEDIKASITSLFGRVLKMGSTKKLVGKLAQCSTASCATSIGNEHGQVIMSVLTASEGHGLKPLIDGLISRYSDAEVPPPEVLYVDQDCCGSTHLPRLFKTWDRMQIRLDIWHFMQRIAVGYTTDSHHLYAGFISQLSRCIFIWDEDDMHALIEAKRSELAARGIHPSTPADVMRHLSQAELALHCRRTTRGSDEMEGLITQLLGGNTLGVPYIYGEKMVEVWKAQKNHLCCLQDPPGVQLYKQTGTLLKGGHALPTYSCARGLTSLESFHLHMNQFIPGDLASDSFFQAYLVDGLARWNQDMGMAAKGRVEPLSYNGPLCHAFNELTEKVLGKKLLSYTPPQKYTGELIGLEYLHHQTGRLDDYRPRLAALDTEEVSVTEDVDYEEPKAKAFVYYTVPIPETLPLPWLLHSAGSPDGLSAPTSRSTASVAPVDY